jgi:hypothetical protein
VHRDAGALVFDVTVWKFVEQLLQAVREATHALDRHREIGMCRAVAMDFNLQPMKARMVDMIGQLGSTPQIVEAPAADDAERHRWPAREGHQQIVALERQFRRCGVWIEFGNRSVEIKQKNKRGPGRAALDGSLHLRKHLVERLNEKAGMNHGAHRRPGGVRVERPVFDIEPACHEIIVAGKSLRMRVNHSGQGRA